MDSFQEAKISENQKSDSTDLINKASSQLEWIQENYFLYSQFQLNPLQEILSPIAKSHKQKTCSIKQILALSPCGEFLAVEQEYSIDIISCADGKKIMSILSNTYGYNLESFFSYDSRYLVVFIKNLKILYNRYSSVSIWNLKEKRKEYSLQYESKTKDKNSLNDFSMSEDKKKFAFLSNNKIIIWDFKTCSEQFFTTSNEKIQGVFLSSDSKYLIIQKSEAVIFYNLKQKFFHKINPDLDTRIDYICCTNEFFVGRIENYYYLWSISGKQETKSIIKSSKYSANISPNGNNLFVNDDMIIYMVSLKDLKNYQNKTGELNFCKLNKFSPCSTFFAYTSKEGVYIYKNQAEVFEFKYPYLTVKFQKAKILMFIEGSTTLVSVNLSEIIFINLIKMSFFKISLEPKLISENQIMFLEDDIDYDLLIFTGEVIHLNDSKILKNTSNNDEKNEEASSQHNLINSENNEKNISIDTEDQLVSSISESKFKNKFIISWCSYKKAFYDPLYWDKSKFTASSKNINDIKNPEVSVDFIFLNYSPTKTICSLLYLDLEIILWNFEENKQVNLIENCEILHCLEYSKDLKFAVVEFKNWTISVWNINEKRIEFTPDIKNHIKSTSFSFNNFYLLITFESEEFKIWDLRSHQQVFHFENEIYSCEFSPSGKFLCVVSRKEFVKIINLEQKIDEILIIFEGKYANLTEFFFTPNESFFIVNYCQNDWKIWDFNKRKEIDLCFIDAGSNKFNLSANDKYLFLAIFKRDRKHYELWNIKKKQLSYSWIKSRKDNNNIDGKILVSPSGNLFASIKIKSTEIFNVKEKTSVIFDPKDFGSSLFRKYHNSINDLSIYLFSNDEEILFFGHTNLIVLFFHRENRCKVYELFNLDSIFSILHTKQNSIIQITNYNTYIEFWNTKSLQKITTLNNNPIIIIKYRKFDNINDYKYRFPDHFSIEITFCNRDTRLIKNEMETFEPLNYVFSQDENFLFFETRNKNIGIYNLKTNKEEYIFDQINDYYLNTMECDMFCLKGKLYPDLVLCPFGKLLAAVNYNGNVFILDIESKKVKFNLVTYFSVQKAYFSTRAEFLASSTPEIIQIWSLNDGSLFCTIYDSAEKIEFSPSNAFLAIKNHSKIKIWNLIINRWVFTFLLRYSINTFEFSKDCQYLLITKDKGTVKYPFLDKLSFALNFCLSCCIKQRESFEDLRKDVIVAMKLYQYDKYFDNGKISAEKKYIELTSKLFIDYYLTNSNNISKVLSKYIIDFAKLGIHLNNLSPQANQILKNHSKITQNFKRFIQSSYDEQIIMYLIHCNNDIEFREHLNKSKQNLVELKGFKQELISVLNPFSDLKIKKKLNIKFDLKTCAYLTINHDLYRIYYFKSSFGKETTIIKKYIFNDNISQENLELFQYELKKEAKCYEIFDNFTCEYYGSLQSEKFFIKKTDSPSSNLINPDSIQQENSFSLVIKDQGETLKNLLKFPKFKSKLKNSCFFKKIVYFFIQAFASMAKINIFHRWICPYSLRIDKHNHVAITDFIFASVKTQNSWHIPKNSLMPEFFQLYRSPEEEKSLEENIDIEKCDVYSLGLVFLELAIFKNISEIKENLEKFLESLFETHLDWLGVILRNMLDDRPQYRMSFSELLNIHIDLDYNS